MKGYLLLIHDGYVCRADFHDTMSGIYPDYHSLMKICPDTYGEDISDYAVGMFIDNNLSISFLEDSWDGYQRVSSETLMFAKARKIITYFLECAKDGMKVEVEYGRLL